MRKKRNLEGRIADCDSVLVGWLLDYDKTRHENNIKEKLDFSEIFGNDNPVILEIGCGKGKFINEIAALYPDKNFLALEKSTNVIVTAMEYTLSQGMGNVKYIIGLAEYLGDVICDKSIESIYLNFSCPFPKKTYANRRLTHKKFLGVYKRILKSGGVIKQKTDNKDFFEYSCLSFTENGYVINTLLRDLHNSDIKGNIMTEYERNFSEKGFPIYYLEAQPDKTN